MKSSPRCFSISPAATIRASSTSGSPACCRGPDFFSLSPSPSAMARKKFDETTDNHERWLISYADFITLLFAFFVVMFASSQTDKSKAKQVSEAVEKALKEGS